MQLATLELKTLAATDHLGQCLARHLPDGSTLGLVGTLGAGKTRLVQAIAAACEIASDQVTSPTYTLHHTYRGTRCLHHLDLYRVRDVDELLELGLEELLDDPTALHLVEWADRFRELLPDTTLWCELVLRERVRSVSLRGSSIHWQNCIDQLTADLGRSGD